ncbi:MAG: right-handed parallel beta-helix repeat-containing protein, partial [Firmicutes bacterium]|nr:right-handed parallel beta-helix repeat-containing protein [Bacillota bacterium]
MKKKKLIAMSLAVVLAVALAAGGTLAYLSGTSITATNNVANDFNWVSLTETESPNGSSGITTDGDGNITNTGYEIIPGTSQDKNPTVNVSYSIDSYVYVTVEDTSGGLITWAAASGWTLLTGTDEYDASGNLTKAVYYRLVQEADTGSTKHTKDNVDYYTNSFSVLDGDSISYSSSITNSQIATFDTDGTPSFLNTDIKLIFQAYIMQADISGTGSADSALSCWNALNAGNTTNVVSVNAGNVAVTTVSGVTTTEAELVVKSASSAYSATVPVGVTIDTDTADIVTSGNTTTTTLILVVEEVGARYTNSSLTISLGTGQSATVYAISIIGVDSTNTTVMEIAMDLGTGLYNVGVEHEGTAMTALTARGTGSYTNQTYYYDSTTGILYIYTDTFSEFAVYSMTSAYVTSDGNTGYSTLSEAIEAGNVVVNEDTNVVYSTLTSAIKEATAGETVTMLDNMTENVTISKSITLDLGGKTLTGSTSASSSVLSADLRGAVTIGSNVTTTITNGTITGDMNGIWCNSTSFDLTLDGVTISGNSYYGIKINSSSTATQTMTIKGDTEISGNKRGIYGLTLILTMEDGTISNNTDTGVWVKSFTMDGGTISGNKGTSGAAVYGGTFVMNGGTISDNTVSGSGGAVFGSDVTINGGSITGTTKGSGIYM